MAGRKLKVLVVTDEMEVGGSQRQITQLLTHLDGTRFEPWLAYFRTPSHLLDRIAERGVHTIELPKRGRIDLRFLASLVRLFRRERFDVVHAFSFTAELWTTVALLACPGTQLVSSIRGKYEWYGPWHWKAKRWISRRSTHVVSNSAAAAAYAFRQMGLDETRLRVVHNGISVPAPPTAPPDCVAELKGVGRWVLTFVGRLVDHKNLPCLLRAMHRLADRVPAMTLLVVGDGPDRRDLEQEARDLALGNVAFLGERTDVDAILAHSDAAVLPSFREGLSNTLLEAMACGLPVVASRVGGNPEIVTHGETGLLFESDDDLALAEALATLYGDPAQAARLGARARAEVRERFSVGEMVSSIEAIYDAAC